MPLRAGTVVWLMFSAALCGQQENPPGTGAVSLLASAKNLYNQSHFPEAEEQLEQAEGLARQSKDVRTLLEIKQLEANTQRTLGRLDQSLRDYEEWFRLNKQLPQPQPEGRTTRYLAILYREMGDTDKSEATSRQALRLARAEHDAQLEAGCLLSIGALYKDRNRYNDAIPWHRKAMALAERENLTRLRAEILNSLADAENHLGRLEAADKDFRRSMEIARATGYLGLEGQVTARTGEVSMARGRYEEAIALFARATELNSQVGDPLTKVLQLELHWAEAEHAAGHPEEALTHYKKAIGASQRLEELTVPTEIERSWAIAGGRQGHEEAAELLVELNRPAEALEVADSGRARAFVDLLNESRIDLRGALSESQRDEEDQLKRDVSARRDQPRELGPALSRLENFYLDLRRSNPAYAQLRRPQPISAQDVQRELADPGAAVVEYMFAQPHSLAWVVTSQGLEVKLLASREQLEPLLASYREAVSEPVTRLTSQSELLRKRKQSRELYQMLVAPLEPALGNSKHLLVIPDGALAYVPLESLIDAQGRYLVEKRTVAYSQSASASLMLRTMAKDQPPAGRSLLALGDPVYDLPSLSPLPYTRDEATSIAEMFPAAERDLRLGSAANESAIKRDDLTRFGYVHFAVHGLVDDREPGRSGLALSHRPDSTEDGVLRAEEIAQLRMNARLVVLSGCATATGKLVEGEGLLAMSRAFYYAGAHSVVASLWDVNDVSTAAYMKTFYQQVLSGSSPEDALRNAKLEMLRGRETLWHDPWFWSSFVVFR